MLSEIGPEVERNIAETHAELLEEAELLRDAVAARRSPRWGRRRRRATAIATSELASDGARPCAGLALRASPSAPPAGRRCR